MKKIVHLAHSFSQKLKNAKHPIAAYILCYTALFALCSLLVFCQFILCGKSFVWRSGGGNLDGISQHYIALSYWGTYLRDIVTTLFTEGRLSIPLFDTSIGMGADVIQTLSYYVIGDPLTLLSALVPRAYTEYLYNFLILLRLYLAGLSFSAFALHLKKDNRFFTLISSQIYIFSGYALYAAVRHPYFSNPMIYFPLVLLGAEYIFGGKKPWIFILSVALAGLSNFYFFYMICILTVLYVLVRMFDYCPKGQRKKIVSYLWRFALFAVLGVMMACVLFYPSVRTTLASSRQDGGGNIPALYDLDYYLNFIFTLPTAAGQGDWDFHGHLPLSLLALVLLWMTPKKENKTEKRLLILCTLLLLIPACGWLLNGMAYVSNRWVWGFNLLVACICAFRLPDLCTLSKKKWGILTLFAALYAALSIALRLSNNYFRLGILGVMISVTAIGAVRLFVQKESLRPLAFKATLLLLVVLQAADFGMARYDRGGYVDDFMYSGTCYENVLEAQAQPLVDLNDTTYHRYEDFFEDKSSRQKNAALVNGGMSTNCYYSLASDGWYELLRSLGHRDTLVQKQLGLDGRTILGALSNVKYYTTTEKHAAFSVPYGYSDAPLFTRWIKNSDLYRRDATGEWEEKLKFVYYRNENALPLGYTYDRYITRAEYDALSYTDRQATLLYNAVLEEDSALLAKGETVTASTTPEITITCGNGVSRQGDTFVTYKKGYIYIEIHNAAPGKETYLSFENLQIRQVDPVTRMKNKGVWEDLLPQEQREYMESAKRFSPDSVFDLTAKMGDLCKFISYRSPDHVYYPGVHDFSVNLGYNETAPTKIRITLPTHGEYTLENITVTQLDLSGYEAQTDKLAKEHLENVVISDNLITGNITVSENKLMCISLPFSPGWRAYVDGKEVEIQQTDIAFMGIELEAGAHEIQLKYFTPYLAFGILVSLAGWSIFIVWFILDRFQNKKKQQKEGSK